MYGMAPTSRIDVHLLTGAYDWASTPEDSKALAARHLPGRHQAGPGNHPGQTRTNNDVMLRAGPAH